MSLPTISGIARLTDDPELRYSASGIAVCKLRLAFNSRRKNQQTGEWEDGDVFFVDGTVFKQEAENVAESLQRGMEVAVIGRLKTHRYETNDGDTRYATELMVDGIGPVLKFATAKVNKLQRGSKAAASADDPWAATTTGITQDFLNDDEPPF